MKTKIGWRTVLTNPFHWAWVDRKVRNANYIEHYKDLGIRTAILVGEDRLARERIWEDMK